MNLNQLHTDKVIEACSFQMAAAIFLHLYSYKLNTETVVIMYLFLLSCMASL